MGAGVLGSKVAQSLQTWRFPLRCWSRTRKSWPGVQSFAGREELSAFLSQCRVLINLLPNTPETVGIINQQLLEKLPDGAYLLNLARGVHVVEDDLLAALDSGKVKGAMLDVFNREPLPPESPLWQHPRVTITPHVAAITRPAEAVEYISRTIAQLEKGGEGLRASRPRTRLLIKHQDSCYLWRELNTGESYVSRRPSYAYRCQHTCI
ncbi:dehydrogenase [Escherichia coli]|uniref:Dehydrogenase n=1 Tax=Escherichia coli TaxID=562 RepID=A0A2X3JKZ2_ECOLX|nr:dehydrogenase [Escherichia coli]